ncbi:MAG: 30S ribosomal protein S15 [Pseudomonadota bacterium]
MALTVEKRAEIIKQFQRSPNDVGSSEVQIAVLTEEIKLLTEHLQKNKKDNHSRRGLLAKVSRRRRLLDYLKRTDFDLYKNVIERLKLRR